MYLLSQDRKCIVNLERYRLDLEGLSIYGITDNQKVFLARYKTEERASEVFEEIIACLRPICILQNIEIDTETTEYIRNISNGGIMVSTGERDIPRVDFVSNGIYELPEE